MGDERGAVAQRIKQRVDRLLQAAKIRRDRFAPALGSGRELPFGQPVDLVVHHDVGQVDISPDDVRHMAPADGETVAIAAGHQDEQVRVRELDPLGNGQGTAMQGVKAVSGRVTGNAAGTANARDKGNLMRGSPDGRQGARDGRDHPEIAATRAPNGFEIAFEVPRLQEAVAWFFECCRHKFYR